MQVHEQKLNSIRNAHCYSIFPDGRPKDFLVRSKVTGQLHMVEVVNIHLPGDLTAKAAIRKLLLQQTWKKIKHEIKGITDTDFLDCLFIAPVVWYLDTAILKDNLPFFSNFTQSFGSSENLKIKTMGFTTYVKMPSNEFVFGEASDIVSRCSF